MIPVESQDGDCLIFDGDINDYIVVEKLDPKKGRKLLGVRLAADGNCLDEFRARKAQSEQFAVQLMQSNASPVDAYMIYLFRYCPAVFYCIPVTYFTSKQCHQIQSPFMNVLLPKLRINRHVRRAVIWGPTQYGGLDLKHMETEQIAKTVESLIGHVRASSPTGKTFVIACETYQLLLGVQQHFFVLDPASCPHRPYATTSKITYIWEQLSKIDGYMILPKMWTPLARHEPCIMDMVLRAKDQFAGTVKCITNETVLLVNACRLWLKALHIEDLMDADGNIQQNLLLGHKQCETDLAFPFQERPPDWVWKIWKQTMYKICLVRKMDTNTILYLPYTVDIPSTIPSITLPTRIDITLPLKDLVQTLPTPFQMMLGDVTYPPDEGVAIARALMDGRATMYTDGTVHEGCGAHAYSIRTETDLEDEALSGAAPTWGDPDTINSLRTEHFGVLAGLLWTWLLMTKYEVESAILEGAVDNITVVTRINTGIDNDANPKDTIASDRDVWDETMDLLKRIPIQCNLRHVKGHQDDLHKTGYQGPLPRDAFWNVQMDKKAESARLTTPTPSAVIFGSSSAEFIHRGRPVHTKISTTIKQAFLDPPLREYIQQKEDWSDETFETVHWTAFRTAMNKLTIHKRINVAKYIFNWQNTGRQKQLFEESQALTEDRQSTCVGMCPMNCGEFETPQHFLQCRVLHEAAVTQRDFHSVRKWLQKQKTHEEMRIVLEKGMLHWMRTGEHIEIWDLQDTEYRNDLKQAIQAQNFIGWHNMLKGRIAANWGELQMKYYKEIYEDELPSYLSENWWASEFIRQLLYFSLATWQHRNTYLHNSMEQAKKLQDRAEAVEEMAEWYERQNEFPKEDSLNFARSFIERCTDTTAQIRLWLGKIVDIHKYNMQTTLRGYFSEAR